MNQTDSICKYCQSNHVIKYGHYKNKQYYFCRDCNRKFVSLYNIPQMKYPAFRIAEVLQMYYEGTSLSHIRQYFIQQYNEHISPETAWNWINKFSQVGNQSFC